VSANRIAAAKGAAPAPVPNREPEIETPDFGRGQNGEIVETTDDRGMPAYVPYADSKNPVKSQLAAVGNQAALRSRPRPTTQGGQGVQGARRVGDRYVIDAPSSSTPAGRRNGVGLQRRTSGSSGSSGSSKSSGDK
jgi:hypothetical protein